MAVSGGFTYLADWDSGLQVCQFYGAGIEEGHKPQTSSLRPQASVVRGVLYIGEVQGQPRSSLGENAGQFPISLLDISGCKVMTLKAGRE